MTGHQHPANIAHHDNASRTVRAVERAVAALGSLRFIAWMTVFIGVWIGANLALGAARGWDPMPFILLNLCFSAQATYAAPLILFAQNRQSEHDRLVAEHSYALLTAIHDRLSPARGDDTERTAP